MGKINYNKKDEKYFSFERKDLISIIPKIYGKVLDVGCGDGTTMNYIMQQGVEDVTGIEYDFSAFNKARNKGLNVIHADVEKNNIDISYEKYDFIIFADILEHLYDPWAVIDKYRKYLKADGTILISIPNIKHYRVLKRLLFCDEFTYVDAGVLDFTHIRFFTRKEVLRMLEACGLRVAVLKYKTNKNFIFRMLSIFAKNWVMTVWPEQFLIAAKIK